MVNVWVTIVPAAEASPSASVLWSAGIGVLVGAALVAAVALLLQNHYKSSREKNQDGRFVGTRKVDVTFARVVGLLTVASLGLVGLALSLVLTADNISAYFTLLGTIAGYLIGAKTGTAETTEKVLDSTGEVMGSSSTSTPTLG